MYLCIKIKKKVQDKLDVAVKYYSVISAINNFNWSDIEIHILAFVAVKGNINAGGARQAFLEWYKKSSKNYLGPLLSTMKKKKKLLVKEGRKLLLNPELAVEFSDNLILQLNISSDC